MVISVARVFELCKISRFGHYLKIYVAQLHAITEKVPFNKPHYRVDSCL